MNKQWNVSVALTGFFAVLIGLSTFYAFYTTQIDFRTCLEALAALYYASLQLVKQLLSNAS